MKPPLRLTVRQVRLLQSQHGIENLLAPTPEDLKKLVQLDVLVDLYRHASSGWDKPPSDDDLEDLTTSELSGALREILGGDTAGNG